MHPLLKESHVILGCKSRGVRLSPNMRLVALTILLWADVWDRPTIDPESIADRTSLKLSDVMGALDKLEHVGLVECYADGWKLTIQRFKQTVRSWCNRVPM